VLPGLYPKPVFELANATVYLQGLRMANDFSTETVYAVGTRLWIDECWFGAFDVAGMYVAVQNRTGIRLRPSTSMVTRARRSSESWLNKDLASVWDRTGARGGAPPRAAFKS
jgi:hypothetical protein